LSSDDLRYWNARQRIKVSSLVRFLLGREAATREAQEVMAAWVCGGDCEQEKNLRMLCLEEVARHLRTGQMNMDYVLSLVRELRAFGMPDTPAKQGPAVR
jgi:hypothetical protein